MDCGLLLYVFAHWEYRRKISAINRPAFSVMQLICSY